MTQILEFAPSLADRFYQEGVSHEEVGALEPAMAAFERAVEFDRTHVDARLALAYHCYRLNRLSDAVTHCRAALARGPTAPVLFALGHTLTARQQYDDALKALHQCLEMDPAFDQARYQIAFVYYLQGLYDVAITEFHRAAHHEPDWETLFFLGECYRMTRRAAEAERTLRRSLAHASDWGQIELTRGQLRACKRLAEFPRDYSLTMKDKIYSDCGVVYLGTATDDGLTIPPYLSCRLDYHDVARTVRRFLSLQQGLGWQWEAVVPVDILSLPLALSIARALGTGTEPVAGGRTLAVQALGETIEGLQDAAERLEGAQTFCLMACWPEEWHADISGVTTPLIGSLPWYQPQADDSDLVPASRRILSTVMPFGKGWIDPRPAERIAVDIMKALAEIAEEPTETAQVDYYRLHQQFRWI